MTTSLEHFPLDLVLPRRKGGLSCLSEMQDSMIGWGSCTSFTSCYFQKRTWLKHLLDSSFRKDCLKWHQEYKSRFVRFGQIQASEDHVLAERGSEFYPCIPLIAECMQIALPSFLYRAPLKGSGQVWWIRGKQLRSPACSKQRNIIFPPLYVSVSLFSHKGGV